MIPGNIFHSELRRHSVDSTHILEVIVFRIPLNFDLPGRNRIISHFSHAEHRVGEDVGFGVGELTSKPLHTVILSTSTWLISFPVSRKNCPTLFQ